MIIFTDVGDHCISDDQLRALIAHTIKLESVIKKYECEIHIINGKKCPRRRK